MGQLTESELKWYLVDFDDTLAFNSGYPDYEIGEPIWENVYKLINVFHAGYKIIIHTSRHSIEHKLIEDWLVKYQVPFRRIVTGKPVGAKYVDDKAINAREESWL